MTSTRAELMQQLNSETSKMPWSELQKFFANGSAVCVDATLDLIEVAADMAQDNKTAITQMMQANTLALVDEVRSQQWLEEDAILWAVVVAPWVLVQAVQPIND